ncbi:hypothetical protein F9L69_10190 [Brucella melitensis]|nr:hypothetical protein ADS42_007435 [Brucella melitensis]EEZ18493.1 predicted protein [Brucella melitensis bv. 2 str. 63/9]RTQ39680.1 hypothetical protein EJW28_12850 [Brucella abortus]ARX98809.1 hypothetical protein BK201_02925 [Brucella melitensis]ARY01982.1 hypothetical protein BK186_02930 [Brucella melitensis]
MRLHLQRTHGHMSCAPASFDNPAARELLPKLYVRKLIFRVEVRKAKILGRTQRVARLKIAPFHKIYGGIF